MTGCCPGEGTLTRKLQVLHLSGHTNYTVNLTTTREPLRLRIPLLALSLCLLDLIGFDKIPAAIPPREHRFKLSHAEFLYRCNYRGPLFPAPR